MDTNQQAVVKTKSAASPAVQNSSWGMCIICQQPIFTSFYKIPVVTDRRRGPYWGRVHVTCHQAQQDNTA